MSRPRLTDADWKTIQRAIHYAMQDRTGFAEAWSSDTREHANALAQVAVFEELHLKVFGKPSFASSEKARIDALPNVSIFPDRNRP